MTFDQRVRAIVSKMDDAGLPMRGRKIYITIEEAKELKKCGSWRYGQIDGRAVPVAYAHELVVLDNIWKFED